MTVYPAAYESLRLSLNHKFSKSARNSPSHSKDSNVQVSHVPSEVTQAIEVVKVEGKCNDALRRQFQPRREIRKDRDEGRRVEGDADGGEDEVAQEDGVHAYTGVESKSARTFSGTAKEAGGTHRPRVQYP